MQPVAAVDGVLYDDLSASLALLHAAKRRATKQSVCGADQAIAMRSPAAVPVLVLPPPQEKKTKKVAQVCLGPTSRVRGEISDRIVRTSQEERVAHARMGPTSRVRE